MALKRKTDYDDGSPALSTDVMDIDRGGLPFRLTLGDVVALAELGAPNIQNVVSAATVTPTFDNDQVNVTAQAAALEFLNPTGTALEGWGIVLRVKDDGTARAITWDTEYRGVGAALPTTTTLGKTMYIPMIYNDTETLWDVFPAQVVP